ncbi:MAG: hypothetical protein NT001_02070, partial [Candidatus Woesearchaeota archaeon]|nr:hypothetical protein [Candidatus Woesearchaeota archaeon]
MKPEEIAIDDLVRRGIEKARGNKALVQRIDNPIEIGSNNRNDNVYCVTVRIADRLIPGTEDFFYHVSSRFGIIRTAYKGYPDSLYQQDQP